MNKQVNIISHSKSAVTGREIISIECDYWRAIHAEVMTHREFGRNAGSSRAIPVKSNLSRVWYNPTYPQYWGKNKSGMQADEEISLFRKMVATVLWNFSSKLACGVAFSLKSLGVHKQVANRVLEPYQNIKVLITTTNLSNFYNLRLHKDAQPEIKSLAQDIFDAHQNSTPIELLPGEWHVPYYEDGYWIPIEENMSVDKFGFTLEDALKISVSCAAQTSYRKNDKSFKKAERIYNDLITSRPVHASPTEHQATPIDYKSDVLATTSGITHVDDRGLLHSGNLTDWIQYRQLIPDNYCDTFNINDTF